MTFSIIRGNSEYFQDSICLQQVLIVRILLLEKQEALSCGTKQGNLGITVGVCASWR
jgi:hypothetical protein